MNRLLRLPTLALAALAFVFLATPVLAQAPKAGKYYQDNVDLGFKVKMPKDWEFTPPQPGENALIGKYTPARNRYINISPENILWLEAYLVKFDRRKKAGDEEDEGASSESDETSSTGAPHTDQQKDLLEWLDDHMIGSGFRVKESKDKSIDKVASTEFLIEGNSNGDLFNVYATVYRLHPDCDVVFLLNGPEDNKKWRKYESSAKSMAKSFRVVELEELELSDAKAGDHGLRSLKRAKLEKEVAMTPGWELYETENYFIISNNDDREFMKELKERLEAIRGVYEEMYPFDDASRIKVAAAKRRAEEGEDEKEDGPRVKPRETTSGYSSQQRSQCSVVRVCKNRTQYMEYGGPGGSAGYWAAYQEELVVYDDKEGGGRGDTWAVLNHEAFHQYIFYLYGSISPHSWYNEGHGDYFAGYEYKHRKFKLTPFKWRKIQVQGMIREERFVPLETIVSWTQRDYYGSSEWGTDGGDHYAQGWSIIWFLRTGKGKASGWNDDWNQILPVYFEALASTEDLEAAVEQAFEGVDFEALTESWKSYTLK